MSIKNLKFAVLIATISLISLINVDIGHAYTTPGGNNFTINPQTGEITSYIGGEPDVVVPSEIDGVEVTSFASTVFSGNTDLVRLTFEGDLEKVYSNSFINTPNLVEVVFEGYVAELETSAFNSMGSGTSAIKFDGAIGEMANYPFEGEYDTIELNFKSDNPDGIQISNLFNNVTANKLLVYGDASISLDSNSLFNSKFNEVIFENNGELIVMRYAITNTEIDDLIFRNNGMLTFNSSSFNKTIIYNYIFENDGDFFSNSYREYSYSYYYDVDKIVEHGGEVIFNNKGSVTLSGEFMDYRPITLLSFGENTTDVKIGRYSFENLAIDKIEFNNSGNLSIEYRAFSGIDPLHPYSLYTLDFNSKGNIVLYEEAIGIDYNSNYRPMFNKVSFNNKGHVTIEEFAFDTNGNIKTIDFKNDGDVQLLPYALSSIAKKEVNFLNSGDTYLGSGSLIGYKSNYSGNNSGGTVALYTVFSQTINSISAMSSSENEAEYENLKSLILPKNVKYLGYSALINNSLSDIYVFNKDLVYNHSTIVSPPEIISENWYGMESITAKSNLSTSNITEESDKVLFDLYQIKNDTITSIKDKPFTFMFETYDWDLDEYGEIYYNTLTQELYTYNEDGERLDHILYDGYTGEHKDIEYITKSWSDLELVPETEGMYAKFYYLEEKNAEFMFSPNYPLIPVGFEYIEIEDDEIYNGYFLTLSDYDKYLDNFGMVVVKLDELNLYDSDNEERFFNAEPLIIDPETYTTFEYDFYLGFYVAENKVTGEFTQLYIEGMYNEYGEDSGSNVNEYDEDYYYDNLYFHFYSKHPLDSFVSFTPSYRYFTVVGMTNIKKAIAMNDNYVDIEDYSKYDLGDMPIYSGQYNTPYSLYPFSQKRTKLYGYNDSTTEEYANKNHHTFVSLLTIEATPTETERNVFDVEIHGASYLDTVDLEIDGEFVATLDVVDNNYSYKTEYEITEDMVINMSISDENHTEFNILNLEYSEDVIEETEGTVTVNYETEDGTILDTKVIENVLFNVEHNETAKDIVGYDVVGNIYKSVTLTTENPNQTITFTYKESVSKGTITVNYETEDGTLLDTKLINDVPFGEEHIELAKDIDGYEVIGASTKTVLLSRENQSETITFVYTEYVNTGTITVNYINVNGDILDTKVLEDVEFGVEVTETPKQIVGYKPIGLLTKTIVLTKENQNAIITFIYEEEVTSGKLFVNYVDKYGTTLDTKEVNNIPFGEEHSELSKDIEGYVLLSAETISVTLTKDNPTQTITFIYELEVSKGNVVVKYVDEEDKIIDFKNVSNIDFDVEHIETAKEIDGYTLIGDIEQTVILTKAEPTKVITFKYGKDTTSGTVTVNYVDSDDNILDTKTINGVIFDVEHTENAKSIIGYVLNDEVTKSVTLTKDNPTQTIVFKYKNEVKVGTINVQYEDTNGAIIGTKVIENIPFGQEYIEEAKSFDGYKVVGETTKSVTLTEDVPTQTIIFIYDLEATVGTITVNYINKVGELLDTTTIENVEFDVEHIENAKVIDGYEVVGESTKSVTLSATNREETITFVYDIVVTDGTVIVNYIDKLGTLLDTKTVTKVAFDVEHIETAKDIDGYTAIGELTKSVTLSKNNQIETITFIYETTITSGTVEVIYSDVEGNVLDKKTVLDVDFGQEHTEVAKTIEGYVVVGESTKSVTLSKLSPIQVITFVYEVEITKGNITVSYVDTNGLVLDTKTVLDVNFGQEHTEIAKTIEGYVVVGESTKSVTLSKVNQSATITFIYEVEITKGNITVNYVDVDGTVLDTKLVENILFGTAHTEIAKDIEDYLVVGQTQQTITLSKELPNAVITFLYDVSITKGNVLVSYVDVDGNVLDTKLVENIAFGQEHTEIAKSIEDYVVVGESTKSVTLSKDIPNATITFIYDVEVKFGSISVINLDQDGVVIGNTVLTDIPFNVPYIVESSTIEGYEVVGINKVMVELSKVNRNETVMFTYSKLLDKEVTPFEPPIDEPIVDEPIVDEPITDEPTTDEPTVDEPTTDEPTTDEPIVDEPIVDEPIVDEPIVDEPSINTDEPNISEPSDYVPNDVVEEKEPTLPKMFTEKTNTLFGMSLLLIGLSTLLYRRKSQTQNK